MKKTIVTIATVLVPFASFAAPIELKPGASIVVNGSVITCQGPSQDQLAPLCNIRQDGNFFRVYAGESVVNSYWQFAEAVQGVKTLKEAGLCR